MLDSSKSNRFFECFAEFWLVHFESTASLFIGLCGSRERERAASFEVPHSEQSAKESAKQSVSKPVISHKYKLKQTKNELKKNRRFSSFSTVSFPTKLNLADSLPKDFFL